MSDVIPMALVPVFFVLLLGYAAGKLPLIDNLDVDVLNARVMDSARLASLFAATASASRREMIQQRPLFLNLGFGIVTLAIAIAMLFPG